MKKWILILAGVLSLGVVSIYVFFPSTIEVVKQVPVKCNTSGAFKYFRDEKKMRAWWPGRGDGPLEYGGYRFAVTQLSYFNTDMRISGNGGDLGSRISVFPGVGVDSTVLQWKCKLGGSGGFFDRIRNYRQSQEAGDAMEGLLNAAAAFLSKKENVYGIAIREGTTQDSCLAVTRVELKAYPSSKDMYAVVEQVRAFLRSEGARETGYPMVNVTTVTDSGIYKMMVALPVDRVLRKKGELYGTRLVPGKYLIADVKGGEASVKNALQELQDYIQDYRRTVMAIPFQSLRTERMTEPDTSKWETRIYYPVF